MDNSSSPTKPDEPEFDSVVKIIKEDKSIYYSSVLQFGSTLAVSNLLDESYKEFSDPKEFNEKNEPFLYGQVDDRSDSIEIFKSLRMHWSQILNSTGRGLFNETIGKLIIDSETDKEQIKELFELVEIKSACLYSALAGLIDSKDEGKIEAGWSGFILSPLLKAEGIQVLSTTRDKLFVSFIDFAKKQKDAPIAFAVLYYVKNDNQIIYKELKNDLKKNHVLNSYKS